LTWTRTESPCTRRSTRAWSAPSCTWQRRGQTSSFLCVCAFVFKCRRGVHISRPSSGSSGIIDTPLSLVFGTWRPFPFRFLVFGCRLCGVSSW
jgi:hypothetical protein